MGGQTLLVKHDLYPSKEALDGEPASGAADGMPEQLEQLDELSPWARAWDSHEVVEDAQDRQRQDRHETAGRPSRQDKPAKAAEGDEPVFAHIIHVAVTRR